MGVKCKAQGGKEKYSRASVSVDSLSAFSVIRGLPRSEKIEKEREINGW
jgi:hypothetical protein